MRPRARMPHTARRVDSIRPLHPDSFRIGILRLSNRQLSASDGRVPGCLAWTPPLSCAAHRRAVSSKQDNQAAAWMVGDPFILPADCDPAICRPTRARLANGWIPGHHTAPVRPSLFRTANTTSDPGLTRAMLELIVAGRPEFRSRHGEPSANHQPCSCSVS